MSAILHPLLLAEPPVLPQQREAEPFAERADQYHPARKSGEFGSVGSAPSSGRALHLPLQVAIVVVRERSHLERVGDRCRSTAIRLSQRNSTHMLGTSPLTHEAQHSAACEQEVHHAAPNRRFSRMCRVSAEDFVLGRGAQR